MVEGAADSPDLAHLESATRDRVLMTISCRDADPIPKVDQAGLTEYRDGLSVQVMHNGLVIERGCYYGPWMDEIIAALHGHHEPQEELVFHTVIARLRESGDEGAMIELGSFWAYYSMWFARERPTARVIAMEPDPAYLEVGRRNAALNGLTERIEFIPGAVGAEPGTAVQFVAESDGQMRPTIQHDLESLMSAAGLLRVALVLSDIQGAEAVLLERSRGQLKHSLRFLIVSTHHHSISGRSTTHQDALESLLAQGAHVIAEHSVSESFSGDGLIAVSFDPSDRDLQVHVSHARARDSLFGGLEVELQRALEANKRAHTKIAKLEIRAEKARVSAERAREEAAAMRNSRLMRWSRRPRQVYRRLKA